ncbi:MAG: hypothetical protein ACRYFX_18090 [Janthinobacterium lividum]
MHQLLRLPGVEQLTPFHFYDAAHHPTRCDLVFHRDHNRAIATEHTDTKGSRLIRCLASLAAAICTKHHLEPQQLVLLNRYEVPGGNSYYAVHFTHTDRDLFVGVSFLSGRNQPVHPVDVPDMLQMLADGNQEKSVLRALQPFSKRS